MLGPSWPHVGPPWRQLGSLGPSLSQNGLKMPSRAPPDPPQTLRMSGFTKGKRRFAVNHIFLFNLPKNTPRRPLGLIFYPSWAPLGVTLAPTWLQLGPTWAQAGSFWNPLAPQVAPKAAQSPPKVTPDGAEARQKVPKVAPDPTKDPIWDHLGLYLVPF